MNIGCSCETMKCQSCRNSVMINFERFYFMNKLSPHFKKFKSRNFEREFKEALHNKNYYECEQILIYTNININKLLSYRTTKNLLKYCIEKWKIEVSSH